MKSQPFGVGCGLIYFGFAMFGVFDGIESWRVIVGTISLGIGVAAFVEGVR